MLRHSSWACGDTPSGQDRNRYSLAGGDSSVNILARTYPATSSYQAGLDVPDGECPPVFILCDRHICKSKGWLLPARWRPHLPFPGRPQHS
jgi:hypothetical protein